MQLTPLRLLAIGLCVPSIFAFSANEPVDYENLVKRATTAATGVTAGDAQPRMEIRTLAQDSDKFSLYVLGMKKFMEMDQSDPLSYYQIMGIHGRPFVSYNDVESYDGAGQGGYCAHVTNMFLPWHRPYLALFEQQLVANVQKAAAEFTGAEGTRMQQLAGTIRAPYWDWAQQPAEGECDVPEFIRTETIKVTTPTGQQEIDNPLFSYKFHPVGNDMGRSPYNFWEQTKRRPNNQQKTAVSNNDEFCSVMENNRVNLRDRVYSLFTKNLNYNTVSTEATQGDSIESVHDMIHIVSGGETGGHMYYLDMSAMDPVFMMHHTNVDRLGALWQQAHPETYVLSGDTTQANWQWPAGTTNNASTNLVPFPNPDGGWWTPDTARSTSIFNYYYPETAPGTDSSSVIARINCIYGDDTSSCQAKSGKQPELSSFAASSSAAASTSAPASSAISSAASSGVVSSAARSSAPAPRSAVSSSSAAPVVDSSSAAAASSEAPAGFAPGASSVAAGSSAAAGSPAAADSSSAAAPAVTSSAASTGSDSSSSGGKAGGKGHFDQWVAKKGERDWTAHHRAHKFGVGGSFSTFFFLGQLENMAKAWMSGVKMPRDLNSTSSSLGYNGTFTNGTGSTTLYMVTRPEYVGMVSVLSSKDKMDAPVFTQGTVPLSSAVYSKYKSGELKSLDEESVEKYLKENLSWYTVKEGGTVIPSSDVEGMDVSVQSQEVKSDASSTAFPSYGEAKSHPAVTHGKPGGSSDSCGSTIEYEFVDDSGNFLYSSMQ